MGRSTTFSLATGDANHPLVMNFRLGIQRRLPRSSVLDVSYAGSLSRHMPQARNSNPIPMYARIDPAGKQVIPKVSSLTSAAPGLIISFAFRIKS